MGEPQRQREQHDAHVRRIQHGLHLRKRLLERAPAAGRRAHQPQPDPRLDGMVCVEAHIEARHKPLTELTG